MKVVVTYFILREKFPRETKEMHKHSSQFTLTYGDKLARVPSKYEAGL
jgi:hypothetical protein